MKKNAAFIDRIQIILDGRDKYPWGQQIGLGNGVIDNMTRNGVIPGSDSLAIIGRAENARVDWLLDARGSPYYVTLADSDDAALAVLEDLATPETWDATIVSDGVRMAVVLDQPGSYDVKDGKNEDGTLRVRTVAYRIVEVIAGAVGPKTIEQVRKRRELGKGISALYVALVDRAGMERIRCGDVGSYRLFQAPDALLVGRTQAGSDHPFFHGFKMPTATPISQEEAALLDRYRAMSPVNRLAVNQVITAIAPDDDDQEAASPAPK